MRKCIRTAAALLLALALAAGLFGCSIPAPIVSGGDKPHTTEPAATGSQTDTEDTQNMENAEDAGEQDWAGEEESSDPAPVETDPPVWEGPETVVYLALYDALAVEYGGYFYYVDRDDNLCRTTTDMTDYTLFCEAQIRGDVRIIAITDAGRMYLSSGGQSCYVDLAEGRDGMAADYGMVESQTFTGAALSIGIRALRGGWMYYTKSGENGLFRAKIGAVPEEENCIVFDKDIREAAVTGDYLIYTYNRGSRADLQVTLADDPDSLLLTIEGNGTYPTTMLAGTDDRSGTPLLLVSRYELIDRGAEYSVYDLSTLELATNSMLDSAKLQRLGYCFGKNGDEIVCFNNCLRFDPFGTFSDGSSQYYPNAYYTDDYLVSFFSITYAGNGWYFFADADQGGATHAIEEGGTELIPLVWPIKSARLPNDGSRENLAQMWCQERRKRYAFQIILNEIVQLRPDRFRAAVLRAVAGALTVFHARNRGQRALRQVQNFGQGVFLRSAIQPVAAALAVNSIDEPGLRQDGHDILQIFSGDLLAVCDLLQGDIFLQPAFRQIDHDAQRIAALC